MLPWMEKISMEAVLITLLLLPLLIVNFYSISILVHANITRAQTKLYIILCSTTATLIFCTLSAYISSLFGWITLGTIVAADDVILAGVHQYVDSRD